MQLDLFDRPPEPKSRASMSSRSRVEMLLSMRRRESSSRADTMKADGSGTRISLRSARSSEPSDFQLQRSGSKSINMSTRSAIKSVS